MSGVVARLFQVLWLVGTVVAGAFFWYTGETRLGIALVVVGLGWLVGGVVVGFAEAFVAAFFEELEEG